LFSNYSLTLIYFCLHLRRACAHVGGTLGRRRAQNGSTALMFAAEKGHVDCVRLLLDAGADKEAKNEVRASAGVVCGALLWSWKPIFFF
jgi:ankyrin repeat protein